MPCYTVHRKDAEQTSKEGAERRDCGKGEVEEGLFNLARSPSSVSSDDAVLSPTMTGTPTRQQRRRTDIRFECDPEEIRVFEFTSSC